MIQKISIGLVVILLSSCADRIPRRSYVPSESPAPDYSKMEVWAAHPLKKDLSDDRPEGNMVYGEERKADVFFLHPTSYLDERGNDQWNAKMGDSRTDQKTDEGAIHFQASAFNAAGYVYAPRYRQAHLHAYFTKDTASARAAFELAYRDVKEAFLYYLQHYNEGRPFILASHSQGTTHAIRLINELIDGKSLQKQLVAAYLLGMPVHKGEFTSLQPCEDPDQTGCFIGWRTFKKGFEPSWKEKDVVVTNPLSWKRNTDYMPAATNPGTILRDFNDIYPKLVDAQINGNILWASKPRFPGSIFLTTKNYHVADVNFYYFSIRNNALNRVENYLKNH